MTNSPYVKSAMALAAMEFVPPLIHKTLLEEVGFRKEFDFLASAVLSFDDLGVSFQRTDLFKAVRNVLAGSSWKQVIDMDGNKWRLNNISEEEELPHLVLSRCKKRLTLPDFAALSPDSTIRLRSFNETASNVNLPNRVRDVWRDILKERALEDDEVDAYHSDIRDTPLVNTQSIRNEIAGGQNSISTLVPTSRRYFERLVGTYDGSVSIHDYAAREVRKFFDRLSMLQPYDVFSFCLFLLSHSSITAEINVDELSNEDIVRSFDFLDKHGDRISQLGAVEVGLRILSSRPEIEPFLIRLIKQIRDDDVDGQGSGFKLLSALFVLVDGELSRNRLMSTEPPFYRRLAALSQAALIHRQFVDFALDTDKLCEMVFSNYALQYYIQSLTDMRMEPRWNPEFSAASQLKAEFISRIILAVKNHEQNIKDSEIYDLVLGNKSESLQSKSDFFKTYLPGPLEGAEESLNILPNEIAETIETQLGAEEVGPSSFIALVNSALIFHVSADKADLAAKALKLGNYRLENVEDRSQILDILNGLATVAAVARSNALADELRILVRRYKRESQYALSIKEAMRICLVAAASRPDLNGWREFVGDWLTELAFSDLEGDDGEVLHSYLQCLCHAVPELWVSCGRADAALMAFNASRHPA